VTIKATPDPTPTALNMCKVDLYKSNPFCDEDFNLTSSYTSAEDEI